MPPDNWDEMSTEKRREYDSDIIGKFDNYANTRKKYLDMPNDEWDRRFPGMRMCWWLDQFELEKNEEEDSEEEKEPWKTVGLIKMNYAYQCKYGEMDQNLSDDLDVLKYNIVE